MATTKITSPDLFNLESLNTALKLPSGTTAERPTSPNTGEWRYNTTTNLVEFWDGGEWRDLQSENIPPINSENFNTVLYDGNSGTQAITGVGFQPDWVWIKQRDTAAENHNLTDSTRGTNKIINSNNGNAEVTSTSRITSFDIDGFTLGNNNETNDSGSKYVAWCWKANGGTTSSNTDGDITSTVQANTKARFSIVTYTGVAPASVPGGITVGHGLGVAPDYIILKNLTRAGYGWYVQTSTGATKNMVLNDTAAQYTAQSAWNNTEPTSTVFTLGWDTGPNFPGDPYVAYCFSSTGGFSKAGTYTGNGTTQVVNTGFKPGWILIKGTVGNDNWRLYDTTRGITAGGFLEPNNTDTDDTADAPNFLILSNGFEITAGGTAVGNNANGNLYTYLAFASDASSAAPTLANSFANKLWTGSGAARDIDVGFPAGFVWLKARNSSGEWHNLQDVVRGATNHVYSNATTAQETTSNGLTAFTSTGFSLGSANGFNNSSSTYVGWTWKANSVPTINTDGTIQSIAAANSNSGFSIVKYTGNGVNGSTVGHSLGVAPEVMIIKSLSSVLYWAVYSKYNTGSSGNPATERLRFNDSGTTSRRSISFTSSTWQPQRMAP